MLCLLRLTSQVYNTIGIDFFSQVLFPDVQWWQKLRKFHKFVRWKKKTGFVTKTHPTSEILLVKPPQ